MKSSLRWPGDPLIVHRELLWLKSWLKKPGVLVICVLAICIRMLAPFPFISTPLSGLNLGLFSTVAYAGIVSVLRMSIMDLPFLLICWSVMWRRSRNALDHGFGRDLVMSGYSSRSIYPAILTAPIFLYAILRLACMIASLTTETVRIAAIHLSERGFYSPDLAEILFGIVIAAPLAAIIDILVCAICIIISARNALLYGSRILSFVLITGVWELIYLGINIVWFSCHEAALAIVPPSLVNSGVFSTGMALFVEIAWVFALFFYLHFLIRGWDRDEKAERALLRLIAGCE